MNGPRYIESNLDEALYRQRCYQIHQDRLKNIKQTKEQVKIIKTQDTLRDKKNAHINRENEVLMNKLIEISKGKWCSISKKPKSSGYRPHSLNLVNRKQESQRITLQNYTLARRILEKPSSIKKNSLDQEYVLHRRLQERIRKSSKIPMYLGRGGHLPPLKAITGRQHLDSSQNGGNSVPGELNQTAPGLSHVEGHEMDQNLGNVSEGNIRATETIDLSKSRNLKQQNSPRLGSKKKSVVANQMASNQTKEEGKVRAYYADPAKSPQKKQTTKKQATKKQDDHKNQEGEINENQKIEDEAKKQDEKAPDKKLSPELSEKKIYGSVSKKSLKKDQSVKNKLNKEESKKAIAHQQPTQESAFQLQEKIPDEQSAKDEQPKQDQHRDLQKEKQKIEQDFGLDKGEQKKQTLNIMQALQAQDEDDGPKPSQDVIAQEDKDQIVQEKQEQLKDEQPEKSENDQQNKQATENQNENIEQNNDQKNNQDTEYKNEDQTEKKEEIEDNNIEQNNEDFEVEQKENDDDDKNVVDENQNKSDDDDKQDDKAANQVQQVIQDPAVQEAA